MTVTVKDEEFKREGSAQRVVTVKAVKGDWGILEYTEESLEVGAWCASSGPFSTTTKRHIQWYIEPLKMDEVENRRQYYEEIQLDTWFGSSCFRSAQKFLNVDPHVVLGLATRERAQAEFSSIVEEAGAEEQFGGFWFVLLPGQGEEARVCVDKIGEDILGGKPDCPDENP